MFDGNKNEDPKAKTNVIILKQKTEYPKGHAKRHAKHHSTKHHKNYPKNYGHKSKDHENSGGYKTKKCFNCPAGHNQFTNPSYARKCPGNYPIAYPGANAGAT